MSGLAVGLVESQVLDLDNGQNCSLIATLINSNKKVTFSHHFLFDVHSNAEDDGRSDRKNDIPAYWYYT